MKPNKNLKYWTIVVASCGLLSSCSDFLTEDCQRALTEDQIYSDVEYTELNLQAIYRNWRECWKDEHVWMSLIGTDEIQSGAFQALKESAERGSMDKFDANLNSLHGRITNEWNLRWPVITSAAKIINALDKDNLEAGTIPAKLAGEAYFIRGSLDFELAMTWGRIPIIDLGRIDELGYGRQPMVNVWEFIISDLEKAARYTPSKNDPGRTTSYAAYTMLGKAYMSAPEETGLRDFQKAKECFEKVMDGTFNLVDYSDLWNYKIKNTRESIMEWQFNYASPDNNQVQFQIGSRAVQNYFGDGCYYSGYDHAVPTQYAYSYVEDGGIWEDGDIRRDENLRYDFTYYGQKPSYDKIAWEDLGDDHDELEPHIKKYEDFRTDSHSGLGVNNMWNSGKNIPMLRYADVLLCYAECQNELGNTAEAVAVVNQVRDRAWEFDMPANMKWDGGMSQAEFRIQIMNERMRELFGEKWRRIDLVRTGNYVKLTREHNKWANRSGLINENHIYWPIPNTEIEQNPDMGPEDQNEGYR